MNSAHVRDVAVVFALDSHYMKALPAFIYSLTHHNPLLPCDFACLIPRQTGAADLSFLAKFFASAELEVELVPVDLPSAGMPVYEHVSTTGNFRLLIPDLLPRLRRAVYLDIDTLVLDSLEPLIHLDLAGEAVAAVRDLFNPCLGWALNGPSLPAAQALRPYCNTGVMVMDLEKWRAGSIGVAAMDFILNSDERLHFVDQCALNLVLNGDFLGLGSEWNFPASGLESPSERRAKILHFVGADKPWMPRYPATGSAKRYWTYQRRAAAQLLNSEYPQSARMGAQRRLT